MKITFEIKKGEKYWIARIPELGVTTQGLTEEQAKQNLKEALEVHLEAMADYLTNDKVFITIPLHPELVSREDFLQHI